MNPVLKEIRHNKLLWSLVFVPLVFASQELEPEAHTLLFVLSVLAIVPLAVLLSHATESVAVKTGDMVGGLLNATLGNLTELVIAIAAWRAGQYMLVRGIHCRGDCPTNCVVHVGREVFSSADSSHVREYNRASAGRRASFFWPRSRC